MSRRAVCGHHSHTWTLQRGVEVCTTCGTRYPCRAEGCGHLDCAQRRGMPTRDRAALEALGIYPR